MDGQMRSLMCGTLIALTPVFLANLLVSWADGSMITPCQMRPDEPQYYVADDHNRCVFYQCAAGTLVKMLCAPGTGTPLEYTISIHNPCTEFINSCQKRGGPRVVTHAPLWTKTKHHYHHSHPTTQHTTMQAKTEPTTTQTAQPTTPEPAKGTTSPVAPTTKRHKINITTTQKTVPMTPTPAATTTPTQTTAAATTCPPDYRPILEAFPGVHGFGARVDPGVISVGDCYILCSSQPNCYGFDWNVTEQSCWIHDRQTECQPLYPGTGVYHYRLVPCGASVQEGFHVSGGTYRPDVTTLNHCVAACSDPCKGLDFDSAQNSCWHHYDDTECNAVIPKATCIHIQLRTPDCDLGTFKPSTTNSPVPTQAQVTRGVSERTTDPPTAPAQTPARGVPPGPSSPSATQARSTPSPPVVETRTTSEDIDISRTTRTIRAPPISKGFVSRYTGRCIPGGIFFSFQNEQGIDVSLSEKDCLNACLKENTCFGVDYNEAERICYVHSRNTVCGRLQERSGCTHYSRIACDEAIRGEVTPYLAIFEQSHVLRGSRLNATYTKVECQMNCQMDDECQGVDYNQDDSTCWTHTMDNECVVPTPKPACTHYRKMSC